MRLPDLAPFANAPQRIETSTWLNPEDRAYLITMLARLRAAYDGLEFALPPGVIHGDANVGNVLRDRYGNPVVIDLDGFAVGPREWDLALTAIYYPAGTPARSMKISSACTASTSWHGRATRSCGQSASS